MIRLLLFSLLLSTIVFGASPQRPNIIYILADDLGYGDLSCLGQKKFTTPHIDRLAAEGMKFNRHYSGSTVCAPSRCVLMTGLHTGACRVRGNDNWIIPDSDVTVPNLLRKAGYTTACFGKYGLGKPLPVDDPNKKGFDEFFGYVDTSHAHNFYPTYLIHNGSEYPLPNKVLPNSGNPNHNGTGVAAPDGRKVYAPAVISEKMHEWLTQTAGAQKPFFLYYALNIPHTNNEAKKDSPLGHGMECPNYGDFETQDWPAAEKGFATLVRILDDEVGKIIAALKEQGIDQNTVVMFASDNGAHAEGGHDSEFFDSNGPFTGIKRSLTDGGIHVPFFVRWPGTVKAGSESKHVSGFQDLLPTVADLSGTTLDGITTQGISFVPTLKGAAGDQKNHSHLFWDFNEQGGKRAVLKWPWKLIHLNTGAGQKGAKGKKKPAALQVQLFNLESDPAEQTNLAAEQPKLVQDLQQIMAESWTEPTK